MNCVCRLVLVVLSLWPERAAARGPPPGPPRAAPDPRAELDSAVLLTRSLLVDTRQLAAQLRDKFPVDGDHSLDSLPTLAMSASALGALQLPSVLTRLRTDLLSYLRHVQWLRRVGGPSLRTLEPELGTLQARLDRLLRRLQLLVRLASGPLLVQPCTLEPQTLSPETLNLGAPASQTHSGDPASRPDHCSEIPGRRPPRLCGPKTEASDPMILPRKSRLSPHDAGDPRSWSPDH
ncbi:interleukin-11 isoform X1 [Heterocephalus glaber]|uniref:Interleukin-11 isoform X1 n=1 Tax=Heterocephalus glaber TaxID=10181 RepID=A0AAX6RY27_HETGA|nr:interleukin-11 isoform X1 [Heterocephalus glaber]